MYKKRNKLLWGALAASFTMLVACQSPQTKQKRVQRLEALKPAFGNPPKEYRAAPLWVWNTDVRKSDIDRMLAELKEQGFGGAFVHPRPGLITEYLSPEWFELYRYSVEKGKELGLDTWIYDENSYPSGFAGGHVNEQMPESYNQGQGLVYNKVTALPDNAGDYFLCLKKEGGTFKDITAQLDDYKGVEGEYYLYSKTQHGRSGWHGGYSYVDLLYPGVTEKFLEVTMSGYEKEFGAELGPVIKGIFSDEPNIAAPGGIRWTPDLFEVFQARWGYDLKECLPLLVEETGDWMRVRHNYMETLNQLFVDRWAKPMSRYCEEKGMLWTGHYWEHDWPNVGGVPDNMAMYPYHQMPAIDMLFNQYNDGNPQAQFGNVRAVKELRSAANQAGRTRTLSETYGGGGWDETFEDFKRLGDWEYVLGVNFMNQHLSHMTLAGARKYDYPPVFTSVSPWWSDYKTLNDYFGRLSLLLSQGEQLNDYLVIEPTTTVWLYFSYYRGHDKTMEVGRWFQDFVTKLEKRQVEYDLGSEHTIRDMGSVKGNRFVVGERAYHTVVIPPKMDNVNSRTFELLKLFVKGGGKIIAFDRPTLVDGRACEELAAFFDENAKSIETYKDLTDELIERKFASEKIRFTEIRSNNLYHHRRTYEDGELVFFVNSSQTEEASAHVAIEGRSLTEMDAMSGNIYAWTCTQNGAFCETDITLPPAGSLMLFCAKKEGETYDPRPQLADGPALDPASPLEVKRVGDNAMPLDFCDLYIDGEVQKDLYTVEACNRLYAHFGMPDPWNSAVQYKKNIVERDTFTTGDIRVDYHFTLSGDVDKNSLKIVAEQPDIWAVKINGQPVLSEKASFLDARFGTYAIGKWAQDGLNTVELSVKPMSIFAEIAPVYLLGDFALQPAQAGWTVGAPAGLAPGSWKAQGLPCYPWAVAYSKTYDIADTQARYALKLGAWAGTVAEVFVNGEKAGVIATKPYDFDLTPHLKAGSNRVEVRVVGSLKNLFGPHYSGDRGIAGPWHWNGVGAQRPGSEYSLTDYGLMEDFSVVKAE